MEGNGEMSTGSNQTSQTELPNGHILEFGEIEFVRPEYGNTCSKFVKLTLNKDEIRDGVNKLESLDGLLDKITHWFFGRQPNLLISVTGGAWDFPIDSRVEEVFRKGIVEAAVSANAWIITGGTNVGVMKYVGSAVSDYEQAKRPLTGEYAKKSLVTVGVATWGTLVESHRTELGEKAGKKEKGKAKIDNNIKKGKREAFLDPNHSFFILVDDGTVHKFGADVKVRGFLENQMSTKWTVSELNNALPMVCIVVEGGPNSIQQAYEASVMHDSPVVVVDRSGRAADVMAIAFDKNACTDKLVDEKLLKIIKVEDKRKDAHNYLREMIREKPHLLNVYKEKSKDKIDQMILRALIKANQITGIHTGVQRIQLDLAQAWNRSDIVEYNEILGHITETLNWENYETEVTHLEVHLGDAIVENQFGFVKLFVENNVVRLEKYLTKEKLQGFYEKRKAKEPLSLFLKSTWLGTCFTKLKDKCCSCCKSNVDKPSLLEEIEDVLQDITSDYFVLTTDPTNGGNRKDDGVFLPDPKRQLFLFALLNGYHEMAEYFWEKGEEHIAAALTARKIYTSMAELDNQTCEAKDNFLQNASKYEELAHEILTRCENLTEGDDTSDLLIRISTRWGNVSHLQLAETTESRKFMSHPAVQTLLRKIWRRGLEPGSGFKENKKNSKVEGCSETNSKDINGTHEIANIDNIQLLQVSQERSLVNNRKDNGNEKTVKSIFKRLVNLNIAPRIKYYLNVVTYIGLLVYFSLIMVTDKLSSKSSQAEKFLVFWVCTYITEEIRQIAQPDLEEKSCKRGTLPFLRNYARQVREYLAYYWNWIDIIMLSLFMLGEVFRAFPNGHEAGRVILAFSLFVFYIRFLHNLTFLKNVGPKVLMIFKMIKDLRFMVIILFVVLVGYGTAVQAIMFPHVTDPSLIARGIFYRPLFQIFGELFLDDFMASEDQRTCGDSFGEDPCPIHVWWGLLCLAFYLILSNILLLNLLIAMFSNTHDKVQEETDIHSKFQFYNLTKEYFNRPLLPPPFIFLLHVYRFIRVVLHFGTKKCCKNIHKSVKWESEKMAYDFTQEDDRKYPKNYDQSLIKMEERCAYNYLRNKYAQKQISDDTSPEKIMARLEKLEQLADKGKAYSIKHQEQTDAVCDKQEDKANETEAQYHESGQQQAQKEDLLTRLQQLEDSVIMVKDSRDKLDQILQKLDTLSDK